MKIKLKDDNLRREHEVIGIAILKDKRRMMFILLDEIEHFYSEVEIVDKRIPIDWQIRILNSQGYLAIIGTEELTYSNDLIEWNYQAYTEAMQKMVKIREKIKMKNFQEKLDYYDEYLNYTEILNSMKYKFIENKNGGVKSDESNL